MAVTDYQSAVDISNHELYVSDPLGIDVKTSPSEYAETIIHLPVNTQVRLMSMYGPRSTMVTEWNSWESNWAAIYLPTGTGYENQIGWIKSADELWWSPNDFDTSGWGSRELKSYLMTSLWEMEYKSDGEIKKRAIVTFEEESIDGIEVFTYGTSSLDLGYYAVISGSIIEISKSKELANGRKSLSISETCFSYEDQKGFYFFKKINIGSIDVMDIFKEFGKESFAIGLMYSISKRNFRMYSKDYYRNKNIADYSLQATPYQNNLTALAVSYGVSTSYGISPNDYKYNSLLSKYWDPYIKECENNIKHNNYSFNKIIKEADFFCIDKLYSTNDRLKLRKTPDISGDVITVMDKWVLVEVTGYGKMVKIDGILSVWLEVEVSENAVDTSGNPIPKGTKGWCFGAYLSDAG